MQLPFKLQHFDIFSVYDPLIHRLHRILKRQVRQFIFGGTAPQEFFISAYGGNEWGDWDQAFVIVNDLDGQPETLAKTKQILEIGKTVSYC